MEPVLVVNLALKFDSLHNWHEQSIRHHPASKQLFSALEWGGGGNQLPRAMADDGARGWVTALN
jgi:hypothetical protein